MFLYRFYITINGQLLKQDEANDILLVDGNKVYVFVDMLEYYYEKNYTDNEEMKNQSISSYFYKEIKRGFVKVDYFEDSFLVDIKYNNETFGKI